MVANFPYPCTISFGAANRQHSKRSSAYQDAPFLASSLFFHKWNTRIASDHRPILNRKPSILLILASRPIASSSSGSCRGDNIPKLAITCGTNRSWWLGSIWSLVTKAQGDIVRATTSVDESWAILPQFFNSGWHMTKRQNPVLAISWDHVGSRLCLSCKTRICYCHMSWLFLSP